MTEATALVERTEFGRNPTLQKPGSEPGLSFPLPVVVGFRRDARASIYFQADPVYHFDTAGRLRRAFAGGKLYKARRGRLVEMVRRRMPQETQLMSRALARDEEAAFLDRMRDGLHELLQALDAGAIRMLRQVPAEAEVAGRARALLESLTGRLPAVAPDVRSR